MELIITELKIEIQLEDLHGFDSQLDLNFFLFLEMDCVCKHFHLHLAASLCREQKLQGRGYA